MVPVYENLDFAKGARLLNAQLELLRAAVFAQEEHNLHGKIIINENDEIQYRGADSLIRTLLTREYPIQVVNQEEFDILCSSDSKFFVQFNDRLYYKNGAGQAVGILTEEDMNNYILRSLMGEPDGVATLDSERKLVQDTDCGEF